MGQHEEKIELMRKYAGRIRTSFDFHIKGNIPSKKIDNALKTFASGMDRTTIIGFYDTTVWGSGKEGFIFTDTKVYYKELLEKPKKLWYDDIKTVEHIGDSIRFDLYDGSIVVWDSNYLNKKPLYEFFTELLSMMHPSEPAKTEPFAYDELDHFGAMAGGYAAGAYGTVNKSFDEERFHARQGHGFAAERANNLFDTLTGHDARVVGDDNSPNGADRIVDGVHIQSKYCATGARCVNECFENDGNGAFRYMFNGKPMHIEVPSDKYDAAVSAMEEKIRRGQVDGVTDPAEAKKIIRKGHFTYEQAKNIAKACTVESLIYDAVNGAVYAAKAFGVTATIAFATSVWNGEEFDKALKIAAYSGLKVGGTTFVTTIVAGQLTKLGLNSALVGSSEAIVAAMGPKASAVLVNAFRGSGRSIYGAAAMKSAAKLLRGNVITAGVSVAVLSTLDIANIFRGRISGKQLFKNIANTASTVAGGTGGMIIGGMIGSVIPGVGTAVGTALGAMGSIIGGAAAGKASNKVLGVFIEDDANEMVRIIERVFSDLAVDYLLSQKEAEKSVDRLGEKLDGKRLKDMYASDDREAFARNLLIPIIENEMAKRQKVAIPNDAQIAIGLKELLEEIYKDIFDAGQKDAVIYL